MGRYDGPRHGVEAGNSFTKTHHYYDYQDRPDYPRLRLRGPRAALSQGIYYPRYRPRVGYLIMNSTNSVAYLGNV